VGKRGCSALLECTHCESTSELLCGIASSSDQHDLYALVGNRLRDSKRRSALWAGPVERCGGKNSNAHTRTIR
jgi:hypothetical protein